MSNVRFWIDGSRILGKRTIAAFDAGLLAERVLKNAGRLVTWRVRCQEPGCTGTYDFSHQKSRLVRLKRCYTHARKYVVAGRASDDPLLFALRKRVEWRRVRGKKGHHPFIRCGHDNCNRFSRFRSGESSYACRQHAPMHNKKRPYESLYNGWLRILVARNQRRHTPLTNTITFAQFVSIAERETNCFYCNKTVLRRKYRFQHEEQRGFATYLDRLNGFKGYSKKNVVTCCSQCNMTKSAYVSPEEMMLLGAVRAGHTLRAHQLINNFKVRFQMWSDAISSMSVSAIYSKKGGIKGLRKAKRYLQQTDGPSLNSAAKR